TGFLELRTSASAAKRAACAKGASARAVAAHRVTELNRVRARTSPPAKVRYSGKQARTAVSSGSARYASVGHASAQVYEWTVTEYCHRTNVAVARGVVSTESVEGRGEREIQSGESVQWECSAGGQGYSTGACAVVVAEVSEG